MCSVERARCARHPRGPVGVPARGRRLPRAPVRVEPWSLADTPAIRAGGRTVLELAGMGIDDIEVVDLYSCFPSAVQLGAAALGPRPRPPADPHRWPVVRRWTVEQLRDARHRHGDGRPAGPPGGEGPRVGQRRLRHEALVRRLRHRARRRRASATRRRRTRSTPARRGPSPCRPTRPDRRSSRPTRSCTTARAGPRPASPRASWPTGGGPGGRRATPDAAAALLRGRVGRPLRHPRRRRAAARCVVSGAVD